MPTGLPPDVQLVHEPALSSTSTEAMRHALAGAPGRLWVMADDQTEGRGRAGRTWQSIPGNLYASYLVRLSCGPALAQQLSLVAGVAVIDALRGAVDDAGRSPPDLCLKWPNDILIGDAKLGGVLVETTIGAGTPGLAAVIGIGLNLAGHPEALARAATSLAEQGIQVKPKTMLGHLAWSLDGWLATWAEGNGLAAVREAWLARGLRQGTAIAVNTGTDRLDGTFAGLDADGALLVHTATGAIRRCAWGDVAVAVPTLGEGR